MDPAQWNIGYFYLPHGVAKTFLWSRTDFVAVFFPLFFFHNITVGHLENCFCLRVDQKSYVEILSHSPSLGVCRWISVEVSVANSYEISQNLPACVQVAFRSSAREKLEYLYWVQWSYIDLYQVKIKFRQPNLFNSFSIFFFKKIPTWY